MLAAEFDYQLPPGLVAQQPATERDQSRLLVLDRSDGTVSHEHFRDFPRHLTVGDVLVLNDSRVVPARCRGVKAGSGGIVEFLLLRENDVNDWWVMLRPGKRVRKGTEIRLRDSQGRMTDIVAKVQEKSLEGHCRLRFQSPENLGVLIEGLGDVPLPPYIRTENRGACSDRERYQTVYARNRGSVAAPTAGLHFTTGTLDTIRNQGVHVCFVTLHVGLGTFAPVKTARLEDHAMHSESFVLPAGTAATINKAKAQG